MLDKAGLSAEAELFIGFRQWLVRHGTEDAVHNIDRLAFIHLAILFLAAVGATAALLAVGRAIRTFAQRYFVNASDRDLVIYRGGVLTRGTRPRG